MWRVVYRVPDCCVVKDRKATPATSIPDKSTQRETRNTAAYAFLGIRKRHAPNEHRAQALEHERPLFWGPVALDREPSHSAARSG